MTLDATKNFAAPLTRERLFAWQAALFPTGRSGRREITVGGWRDDAHGPMQVVSGAVGHQRIHDGNGRIARALADMSLARSENSPNRFYSLSSQIRRDRPEYYGSLEHTEKGDLDVTAWLLWFLECFSKAIDAADQDCAGILRKADFWQRHSLTPLSERQRTVLHRVLGEFDGKLTARKWAALTRCSVATAQRDLRCY